MNPVPPIDFLLRHRFWELHEAAFILVDRWPKDVCYWGAPRLPWLDGLDERNAYLAPLTESGYCPKQLGREFQKALAILERGILSGDLLNLPANLHLSCYGANQTFLIPPIDAITLGLSNDLILSQALATHLGIEQIKETQKKRNLLKITRDQTIAQFILSREQIISISDLCRHDLMKRFGSGQTSCDAELKSIRRAVEPLIVGNKPIDYSPAPLASIKQGAALRFSLLKEVAKTISSLAIDSIGLEKIEGYTEGEMIQSMLSNPILEMYIAEASNFTKIFVRRWCLDRLLRIYSHPRMLEIPAQTRKDMKIAELKYIHIRWGLKGMRVETFPPAEKEKFAPLLNEAEKLERRIDPTRLPFVQNFFLKGNRE
jgi:hypothetical protein